MHYKNKYNNKGQILVITLLILMFLSIIVLSTVIILSSDVRQRSYNQAYDENYTLAESRLIQVSEKIDEQEVVNNLNSYCNSTEFLDIFRNSITTGNSNASCSANAALNECVCEISEGNDSVTDLSVTLDNKVEDFEMNTTDSLQINLENGASSFQGQITLSYTHPAGVNQVFLDISLIYRRRYNGQSFYEIIKLNRSSTQSTGIVNHTLDLSPIANNINTDFEKNVALRIRPLMPSSPNSIINLTLKPDLGGNLPPQFIVLRSQSSLTTSQDDLLYPSPLLAVKIPIYSSPPAIFDYVYYTNKDIETP